MATDSRMVLLSFLMTVLILIDKTNGDCDSNQNNLTFVIKFDYWPLQVSWNLTQWGNGGNVLMSGNGIESNEFAALSDSVCVDSGPGSCFSLNLYDLGGDGLYSGADDYGWFLLQLNGEPVTINKQTFDTDTTSLFFCNQLFSSNNENDNKLQFIFSELASFDVLKITINNSETNSMMYNNFYQLPSFLEPITTSHNILITSGCYDIEISTSSDRTFTGNYELRLNNEFIISSTSNSVNTSSLVYICTNNFTPGPTTAPVESPLVSGFDVDYVFNVGKNGVYETLAYFGCKTFGCTKLRTWQINGTSACSNPRITVTIANGDFDQSYETAMIYINDNFIGVCNELIEHCSNNFLECTDTAGDLDLTEYLVYDDNNDDIAYVKVTLRASSYVDFCPFNEIYYLFAQVVIKCDTPANTTSEDEIEYVASCNETTYTFVNNSGSGGELIHTPNDLALFIQLDYAPDNISWTVVDDSNGVVLLSRDGSNFKPLELSIDSVCLAVDDCISINLYDKEGNGLSTSIGWFRVLLNNELITYDKQAFDDSEMTVEFCNELFKLTNDDGSAEYNNFSLSIDYETNIEFINISESSTVYKSTLIASEDSESSSDSGEKSYLRLSIVDGCFSIIFSDSSKSEDTDTADTFDDGLTHTISFTHYGSYQIKMNSHLVGFGGYYDASETRTVCTDSNHISYCIVGGFCANRSDIFMTSLEESENSGMMYSYSHDGLVNITYRELEHDLGCFGTYSCKYSYFKIDVLNCYGVYSCMNATLESNGLRFTANCYGLASCYYLGQIGTTVVNTFGVSAIVAPITAFEWLQIYMTFSVNHVTIHSDEITSANVFFDAYFGMYNVTIECHDVTELWIWCEDTRDTQFIIIDDSCGYAYIDAPCNIVDNVNDIDNVTNTIFSKLKKLIDDNILSGDYNYNGIAVNGANTVFSKECDDEINNKSLVFDTGYPLYIDENIINENEDGNICCRGYRSCALTNTITTKSGSIYCAAYQSCVDSTLIWAENSELDDANVFCLSNYACSRSILEAKNSIICGSHHSCQYGIILAAQELFCVKFACLGSVARKIETIYIIERQIDMIIYSGSIGESKLYLRGREAGYGITYYCDEGDTCYIDCGNYSCSSNETFLYCDGKCFVECNDKTNPDSTDCVSIESSLAPTAAPTDNSLLNEDDVIEWFNWILASGSALTVVLIIVGIYDAKRARPNELFQAKSILVFAFYASDFLSDIFFCIKLSISAFLEIDSEYQEVYTILFVLSLVFIVTPVGFNIAQLHLEISEWTNDPIIQYTTAAHWIKSRIKALYILSVICGSSFSAIALCNSYLLQIPMFCMSLSLYHQRLFAKKRFFSVVLIENVPQLAIQICTLVVSVYEDKIDSSLLVTIFSMVFTIISIVASIFEYMLTSKFITAGSVIVIRFKVFSMNLANMGYRTFRSTIVFKRRKFLYYIAKLLRLNKAHIERLIPLQETDGANFILVIDSNSGVFESIIHATRMHAANGKLAKVKSREGDALMYSAFYWFEFCFLSFCFVF